MDRLFSALLIVTVVVAVLSLGLVISLREVVSTFRRRGLVGALVVTNVLAVPALALATATVLDLGDAERTSLVLVFSGAGGAIVLKLLLSVPGADLPLALSMTVTLEVAATVTVPLWAGVVAPSSPVDGRAALVTVVSLVLVPLLVGTLAARVAPVPAHRVAPVLARVATVGLALVILTGITAYRRELADALLSRTTVAALLAAVLTLALGAVVGRAFRAHAGTTALITGCRFSSLGLVVVDRAFAGQDEVRGAAIVVVLVVLVVPTTLSAVLYARGARVTGEVPVSPAP